MVALLLRYRLPPDHPWPAARDDLLAALDYACSAEAARWRIDPSRLSVLGFSAGVLFAVAWNEGWGVVKNTPVTFYRCDGMGHDCCKNGPHGLGAHPRFAYLSDGRGFETRQKDSMRRHLLRSRRCRELKPVVVYPKEEGWRLF